MDLGHLLLITLGVGVALYFRRRAAARREREREFLAAVLDHVHDGVAACDADGVLTLFNDALVEMHGLPQEPITSEHWAGQYDLYRADGTTPLPREEIPLYRAYRGEHVRDEEIVIAPRGLPHRLVRCNGRALIGPDGERMGAAVTMQDLSQQRCAEMRWREAQQIIENSASILFKWRNQDGWPVEFVTANVVQLGYSPDDFLSGRFSYADIVHPEDRSRLESHVERILADGRDQVMLNYRLLDRSGQVRWVEEYTVVQRDERGRATGFHGLIVDVTEREFIAQMLQENEERMDFVLAGADLGSWDWDVATGRIVFNERFAQVLGHRVDELDFDHDTWRRLLHDDDRDEAVARLEAHLAGESPCYETEFRLRRKDGRWVWVEWRGKVMDRDAKGRPRRMAGTLQDVTERRRARTRARELEQKLRQAQKLESLGVLAGGIAHDFNNILMAILGNAELARLDLGEDTPAGVHLAEIEAASSRAADLCNQLLAYSGKGRFQVRPVDLSASVREIGRMLRVSVPTHVELKYELAGDLPAVSGDVGQLRQVIMNLVTNAAEAIGERPGVIHARTWAEPADRPTRVICEITDDGCGMNEETRERLFEPFFTTKFAGRGLGLAAVQGIVRGHGGEIAVRSEPGAGTLVRITLPAVEEAADKADAPAPAAPTARSGRHDGCILLADDEDAVRRLGARLLESLGWNVLLAEDGEEAVALARRREDLTAAILDLTMPRLDGVAALHRLRKLRPGLPVIMSSGYHASEVASRVHDDVAFIQKPYRRDELAAALDEVLAVAAPV